MNVYGCSIGCSIRVNNLFFLELLMPEIFLKFCRSFENDVANKLKKNLNEYKK